MKNLAFFLAGFFLVILAGSASAATCYKQALFYGCSNSSGTTCTKVTVTALIPDTVTAVGSCPYLTVTGAEYTTFANDSTGQANLTTRVTAVEGRASALETRAGNLEVRAGNLETRTGAVETALSNWNTSLTGWDSKIAANTQAVGTLNQILNEPFDLATGMAAFAFFFSTTLFFYGVSRGAGAILEMIRRPMGRG